MELRKNITPPKRYRPDDIPRHSRAYVPRAMRPILPTPFVKYNPNLPPAAFPTLSEPRPPREVEQVLNKIVQDDPSDEDEDEDDDMFQGPDPGDAWRHLIEQLSFIDTESRDPDEGFIDENAVLTSVVLATRVTHALIYRYNLVQSSRHSPAASVKEADDEVGTTEEGQVSRRQGKCAQVPIWPDVSPTHRLAIVTRLLHDYPLLVVYAMLDLTPSERVDEQRRRVRHDRQGQREEKGIQRLQAKVHEMILRNGDMNASTGGTESPRGISDQSPQLARHEQAYFTHLVERYLYPNAVGAGDKGVTTRRELKVARDFLAARGLDPGILGRWGNIFAVDRTSAPTPRPHAEDPFASRILQHADHTRSPPVRQSQTGQRDASSKSDRSTRGPTKSPRHRPNVIFVRPTTVNQLPTPSDSDAGGLTPTGQTQVQKPVSRVLGSRKPYLTVRRRAQAQDIAIAALEASEME